jgi:release factor glutamine methyltransferase
MTRDALVERLRDAGCVFAEDEADLLLDSADGHALEDLAARRVAGEPLEHLLGWVAFDGLRLVVEPGVFVPRRRTELMVHEAVHLAGDLSAPVLVDLCCGCGAVGVAVAKRLGRGTLVAGDVDPAAVHCAARNVALVDGQAVQGDLFDALPAELRGGIDVLTANVPYVPSDAVALMPPEAREHEPRTALDGGHDGLGVLARVAVAAPEWLAPGGSLLVETSEQQVPDALRLLIGAGLAARVAADDELGATVLVGTAPGGTDLSV